MDEKKRRPERVGDVLEQLLSRSGLGERIDQASAITEWAAAVGAQIAGVTEPLSVTADGTLFVGVTTNAWMTELSLMERELVRALNARTGGPPVRRIRWVLRR